MVGRNEMFCLAWEKETENLKDAQVHPLFLLLAQTILRPWSITNPFPQKSNELICWQQCSSSLLSCHKTWHRDSYSTAKHDSHNSVCTKPLRQKGIQTVQRFWGRGWDCRGEPDALVGPIRSTSGVSHSMTSKERTGTHLINEWCEFVVECLNLLFLIWPHSLELRVNLHLCWPQQVGVDMDLLDASTSSSVSQALPSPLLTKASTECSPAWASSIRPTFPTLKIPYKIPSSP